ncbi:MAG: L-threonylcarbamoyladenylate synthase [Candidatus Marinimicrobia bacterium]|nr:L-threonylcarbamoyladenylate synthase [Candidatus Neomarinimicrobiota bacterium]
MISFIQNYEENKERIISALKRGKILAYPTDTLFGLGVDALNVEAVNSLYDLKKRPKMFPFSIMVSDLSVILKNVSVPPKVSLFLTKVFPGPVTAVLPLKEDSLFQSAILKDHYMGFRIPQHPFCQWLGHNYDHPVVTTSANPSGKTPLLTLKDIALYYQHKIDLYIDDPSPDYKHFNKPSTVFKITEEGFFEILREGQIPRETLKKMYQRCMS